MRSPLIACVLLLLAACGGKPALPPDPKTATLEIRGMTCENCVNGITASLGKVPGVEQCEVSLVNSNAVVRFDANRTGAEALAKRVNGLGFKATVKDPAPQP
jgi:copper chaperone CopZ